MAQHRGPVDNRRIDHLATPRGVPLEQGGKHADDREQRAATVVADQVEGW
jgi:hypothetical protein